MHERVRPECAHIHRELKRDGVTLQLLSEEYAQVHPHGYRYTQFCEIYRQWARRLRPSMRQVHRAGEKTFIDFSGKRPTLIDPRTGELRRVELFVAVLGASSLTYAEATTTQQLPDWVDAHVRMVEFFGGTTALWVPDQLKSAVTRPCRYEPGVNRTYEDLAAHCGAVVVPARPRKPRDKAAVEGAVLLAQRWILARLRDETFFSLGALNQAIRVLLDELNDRPMKEAGRQPPRPLRAARPSGPPAPAGHALRPRAVEAVPPQHRLPRHRRATRLQRAVPAPPRHVVPADQRTRLAVLDHPGHQPRLRRSSPTAGAPGRTARSPVRRSSILVSPVPGDGGALLHLDRAARAGHDAGRVGPVVDLGERRGPGVAVGEDQVVDLEAADRFGEMGSRFRIGW